MTIHIQTSHLTHRLRVCLSPKMGHRLNRSDKLSVFCSLPRLTVFIQQLKNARPSSSTYHLYPFRSHRPQSDPQIRYFIFNRLLTDHWSTISIVSLTGLTAMTERLCEWNDPNIRGRPTAEYLKLYEEWGKGAIGKLFLTRVCGAIS